MIQQTLYAAVFSNWRAAENFNGPKTIPAKGLSFLERGDSTYDECLASHAVSV
jgi:hypothetical protein